MKKKLQRALLLLVLSMFLGLISTHYLEGIETRFLIPIRDTILFGIEEKQQTDDVIKVSQYKFTDQPQINPVHVAQQVRSETNKLFDNEKLTKEEIENIITIADFLIDYKEEFVYEKIKYSIWPYNFSYPTYQLEAPWYSGMAQGLGLEVLLAAYELTGQDRYIQEARLAANALYVPVKQGGVAVYLDNGDSGIWFEEYAQKNTSPPTVLNGHSFALIGLKQLTYFDKAYIPLYKQGIKALEYKLPEFDAKVWSRYDLVKYMANPKYHQIHIDQLNYLGEKENNDILLKSAQKFTLQKYIPLGATYRIIFYPHNSLISIACLNTIGIFLLFNSLTYKNRRNNRS